MSLLRRRLPGSTPSPSSELPLVAFTSSNVDCRYISSLHWGASNPSDGTLDFDHFRAVLPVIELCKENGLWMVMRPGPYINVSCLIPRQGDISSMSSNADFLPHPIRLRPMVSRSEGYADLRLVLLSSSSLLCFLAGGIPGWSVSVCRSSIVRRL